jgi:hypothetical protein
MFGRIEPQKSRPKPTKNDRNPIAAFSMIVAVKSRRASHCQRAESRARTIAIPIDVVGEEIFVRSRQ